MKLLKITIINIIILLVSITTASSASYTISWTPNDPSPEGYRVFVREDGKSYDYNSPTWQGEENTCILTNLNEDTTYLFVVRAFSGRNESPDSKEITITKKIPNKNLKKKKDPLTSNAEK